MKKLLLAIALIIMTGIAPIHAQDAAAKPTSHMKKDGTPDRRYKSNKTVKTAGPTKKDGTADMRYKSNNAAAGSKKAPRK